MKSLNLFSLLLFTLIGQSCSFDKLKSIGSLETEVDMSDTFTITEDDLFFDQENKHKHALYRSDTIYEDIPKKELIEKENTLEMRKPASLDDGYDLYVVKEYDTAMKIAFYLYKDVRKWKEIRDLNGTTSLLVGETIKVPKIPEILEYNRPEGEPYLIKKDDTLGKISQEVYKGQARYWINIWDNNKEIIDDYDLVFTGFTLYYKDYEIVKNEYHSVRSKYNFSDPKRRDISSKE